MKLLFPNGDHAPFELREGRVRVGSGEEAELRLGAEGIQPEHCVIETANGQSRIASIANGARVLLNGRLLAGEAALKPGDLLAFAGVQCRVVAVERGPTAAPVRAPQAPVDESGRTAIRMAVPRFVLRGVSGPTFGKNFPLIGTVTVGRMSECEISLPFEGISRRHARLQTVPEGILVEDLGSSNGTFINDERIHKALLKPGDELKLDTLRFLLVQPGSEPAKTAKTASKAAAARAPVPSPGRGVSPWIWVAGGVLALALLAGVLRWLGWI
ncbi:MAG: FHA domain-containing protein [Xanthomonadales bacterium]|nr:FHA domain-containing protein [Xanthomonadales bacterium]